MLSSFVCHRLLLVMIFSFSFLYKAHGQCRERNETEAQSVGRSCRQACEVEGAPCRKSRVCLCDHECGYACVNPMIPCDVPPTIENQNGIHVFRKTSSGKIEAALPPYKYNDMASYSCRPGFVKESNVAFHHCDSRKTWIGRTVCAVHCSEQSYENANRSIICGEVCRSDSDCPQNGICVCNGHCGLSCISKFFSPWIPTQSCSASCGGGVTTEVRSCLRPGFCFGRTSVEVTCNNHTCPGSWSDWNAWSPCSQSCDTGIQNRTRSCIGMDCVGNNTQVRICAQQDCPTWEVWEQQTECSVTCGGGSLRLTRSCIGGNTCVGPKIFMANCGAEDCPGNWRRWGSWSGCSQTCGTGTRTRQRSCAGSGCLGASNELGRCNTSPCPASCNWASWRSWSSCSSSTPRRSRNRVCNGCPGSSIDTNMCPPRVVGPWGLWSSCSRTCGVGIRTRSRTCNRRPCTALTQKRDCRLRACSARPCEAPGGPNDPRCPAPFL